MQCFSFKKAAVIYLLTMTAVSTVFMNQAVFLELSVFFKIKTAHARLSFGFASLGYSLTFLLAGPVMDRCNLTRMAFYSAVLLAGILMAVSFVTGYGLFLASMLPMGAGAALVAASMFPYVTIHAPDKNKGVYVGAIVASATLGVIWGRFLCGVLTSKIGWTGAYQVIAVLIFVCALLLKTMGTAESRRETADNPSIIAAYKTAFQIILRPRIMALMIIGTTLFFGFLGVVTFLTYRLNHPPFNFNAAQIGWISFAGITALVAPFSGRLSSKISIEKIIICGLAASVLSALILGWAQTIPMTVAGLLLLFLSVYICQPLIFMMVANSVPATHLGSASSLYIFFCIGSGSLSSLLLGPVWVRLGWPGIVAVCCVSIMVSLVLMLRLFLMHPAK